MKIPGKQLGLGTFVNSDVDAKRKIVYHGVVTWTAANYDRTLTQGVTKMATIESVIIGRDNIDAKGSASTFFSVGTISNGTVKFHLRDYVSLGAATNVRAVKMSFWIVGSPDPQRIIV